MEENITVKKAVTLDSLREASKLIATKDEVDKKIAKAVTTCANITAATTEEVLALFREDASDSEA